MNDPSPPAEAQYRELILQRLAVYARHHLSPQVLHDLQTDVVMDHVTQRLVLQMRSYVLAERLLTDDQTAHFSRTVTVEQPAPRFLVVPQAVLVFAATALGLALSSLPLILMACALTLVSIVAYAANPPRTHERTVSGEVTIPVTSYATFPENTTVYPRDLGPIVRVQQVEAPYWRYDQ